MLPVEALRQETPGFSETPSTGSPALPSWLPAAGLERFASLLPETPAKILVISPYANEITQWLKTKDYAAESLDLASLQTSHEKLANKFDAVLACEVAMDFEWSDLLYASHDWLITNASLFLLDTISIHRNSVGYEPTPYGEHLKRQAERAGFKTLDDIDLTAEHAAMQKVRNKVRNRVHPDHQSKLSSDFDEKQQAFHLMHFQLLRKPRITVSRSREQDQPAISQWFKEVFEHKLSLERLTVMRGFLNS